MAFSCSPLLPLAVIVISAVGLAKPARADSVSPAVETVRVLKAAPPGARRLERQLALARLRTRPARSEQPECRHLGCGSRFLVLGVAY